MENLNAEQVIKALECCSSSDCASACESGCPYWGGVYDACTCVDDPNFIIKKALALIKSQEQRIRELTAKVAKWEEECDLRGDMWCKLNEENKRLTDENERLKAEIDSLAVSEVKECEISQMLVYRIRNKHPAVMAVIADTVRKMQERLKAEMRNTAKYSFGGRDYSVIGKGFIDQIAKEMIGEGK